MEQILLQNRFFESKSKLKTKIFPIKAQQRSVAGKKKGLLHIKMIGRLGKKANLFPPWPERRGGQGRFQYKRNSQFSSQKMETGAATVYINSTHNNTIYTLAGAKGNVYCCVPTGVCGFKNARKSTSYAAQAAAEKLGVLAKNDNIASVRIKMRGMGPGKLSGVRALQNSGFRCVQICECTPLPHNGCRPSRVRRV